MFDCPSPPSLCRINAEQALQDGTTTTKVIMLVDRPSAAMGRAWAVCVCFSVRLCLYLYLCLCKRFSGFVYLSVCLSTGLSICMFICLSLSLALLLDLSLDVSFALAVCASGSHPRSISSAIARSRIFPFSLSLYLSLS